MKQNYLLLLTLILGFKCYSQTTVTLTPSKDAAIGFHDGANTANNNYGTATQNAAYFIPGISGPTNGNRALIDFNLSAIPPGATILSAKLNLYAFGTIGSYAGHTGTSNSTYLNRITQNWLETSVTWSTQPTATSLNQITLANSTNPTQDYLNINVLPLVNDMIMNPSSSFGFQLKLINEAQTNILAFCSKENPTQSKTPQLIITYSVSTLCNDSISVIADYDAAIGYHDGANTAGNNYGGASQNAAYAIPATASVGGLNINRALIHFNLSTIPLTATITSAKLDLYAYGPIGTYPGHSGTNNNAVLQRVTGNWTEYGVTWNNQPLTSTINQTNLAGTNNATLDYLNTNVTALINDVYTSPTNNGLMLKLVTENATNLLPFCSKDHVNVNKRPRLRVTYKTCDIVSSIKKSTGNINQLSVFPNPTSANINFALSTEKTGKGSISIFNTQGKLINLITVDITNNGLQQTYSLNTETLNSGLYFYSLQFEGDKKDGKFIID